MYKDIFNINEMVRFDRKNIYKPNKNREITLSEFDYNYENGEWIEFPLTLYGDYVGSTTERANFNVLKDELKGVPNVLFAYGDHNSAVVMIKISTYTKYKKVKELIEELEKNCCLNTDEATQIEFEIEGEAWINWIKNDLISGLEKENKSFPENEDELKKKFYVICDQINEYPIFETANTCYVDIDKIVKNWD